jgi:hypothetical protein
LTVKEDLGASLLAAGADPSTTSLPIVKDVWFVFWDVLLRLEKRG